MMQVYAEMEELLVNGIIAPGIVVEIWYMQWSWDSHSFIQFWCHFPRLALRWRKRRKEKREEEVIILKRAASPLHFRQGLAAPGPRWCRFVMEKSEKWHSGSMRHTRLPRVVTAWSRCSLSMGKTTSSDLVAAGILKDATTCGWMRVSV